jgi:hypothetical protein
MDLSKVVMTLKGKVPPEIPPISGIFEMTKKECLRGASPSWKLILPVIQKALGIDTAK